MFAKCPREIKKDGWKIHNSTHAPLSLLVSLEAMLQDSAEAVRGATRSSFEFVLRDCMKG